MMRCWREQQLELAQISKHTVGRQHKQEHSVMKSKQRETTMMRLIRHMLYLALFYVGGSETRQCRIRNEKELSRTEKH